MSVLAQTVDEYLQTLPPDKRAALEAVRAAVLASVPDGEERISYRMPALFCHGVVIYYAAFKSHLGVFPPVEDTRLRAKVRPYAGPKGNLQFPFSQPIPCDLIAEVARTRWQSNLAKAARKPDGSRSPSRAKRPAS